MALVASIDIRVEGKLIDLSPVTVESGLAPAAVTAPAKANEEIVSVPSGTI